MLHELTDRQADREREKERDEPTERRNVNLITGHTMKCGPHKSHLPHALPAIVCRTFLSVALDMAPSGCATATGAVAATKLSKLAQMLLPLLR